jgi:tetratricopeptide (TPR) repeat protein
MRILVALAIPVALATAALAATPRVTFNRTVPAPHDLGPAEEVAILYGIGDNERLPDLLEIFVARVNDSNTLRARDTTLGGRRFLSLAERPDPATIEKIHRAEPADVYLGFKEFTCRSEDRSGEGTTLDASGNKVKRRHVFVEAVCTARVDVLSGKDLRKTSSFAIKGEGQSSRVDAIGSEERVAAVREAARYAAINAAEHLTPRRIRESVLLDETAPAFDEGLQMIEASRHDEALRIWTAALRRYGDSAALHYNLGAVAEALGERETAEKHYNEARRLAPDRSRYRDELRSFQRRNQKK